MYKLVLGRLWRNLDHELPHINKIEDRFRHVYILGTTGSGKTTLMLRMALYDINYGCACIFIDPKGEHAKMLYRLAPDKSRVVYFSLTNPCFKINPLRKKGYELTNMIDELSEILDILIKQTSPTNPPASENMKELLFEAVTNINEEDRNIDFLYKFLRYEEVRDQYFQAHGLEKPLFWRDFDKKDKTGKPTKQSLAETATRLSTRLSKFEKDYRLKKIITGPNELDIAEIAKNRLAVIVDTSEMTIEKRVYVTSLFSCAVKSYVEFQKQAEYHPLMFYLDECWMGMNSSFEYLLAFGRSFKVGFTVAHQGLSQFGKDRDTLDTIINCCNTKVFFFPAGDKEARLMADITSLPKSEFSNLLKYEAWVRIYSYNSFIQTFPQPPPAIYQEPPKGELSEKPLADEMETEQPPAYSFLRDCWFSCGG